MKRDGKRKRENGWLVKEISVTNAKGEEHNEFMR